MAPVKRGWGSYFVDRLVGWWSGLPGESCSYTVETVHIPTEDQHVNLAANVYRPTIAKPHGTILVRSSYGIGSLMALGSARMLAPRGYVVLLAACRGTDPSDGAELVPAVHEAADGLAAVAWMRKQPWYTGSFGTYGGSYLGYTQWAILSDPPPDMKVAVISTGPADFSDFIWGTGAMDAHAVAWADLMTARKRGVEPGPAYIKKQPQTLQPVYDSVPLMAGIDKHFQGEAPDWFIQILTKPDLSDPYYQPMSQTASLERANLPILQFTGWNDKLLSGVTKQHEALTRRGCPAYITLGPWSHLGSQRGLAIVEALNFIDAHLGQRGESFRTAPVRVFVTGAKQWRELPQWPPTPASTHELYLGPNKTLSSKLVAADDTPGSTFEFDPANPTPSMGMARPFDDVIPANYEDTALAQRSDVVDFTTEPLSADLEICGRPEIELYHSSDNPHVDILVRVSEVDKRGKSMRISEVYKRLDPARQAGPLKLTLSDCAHRFCKGTRIRLVIAGGAHPAYVRNLGTGENPATGATTQPALHTVHHSAETVSKLLLPVAA